MSNEQSNQTVRNVKKCMPGRASGMFDNSDGFIISVTGGEPKKIKEKSATDLLTKRRERNA